MGDIKKIFSASRLKTCQDEVDKMNYRSLEIYLLATAVITFAVFIFVLIFQTTSETYLFVDKQYEPYMYILFGGTAALTLALYLIFRFVFSDAKKAALPVFYVLITLITLGAIMMGTFLDTSHATITFFILLCILPMFIVDVFWRWFAYLTLISTVYIVMCYFAKAASNHSVFLQDMLNFIFFYYTAFCTNAFTHEILLSNAEDKMILEKKASTDLLTGLDNHITGIEKIEKIVGNHSEGAFIIADIDNFKLVNDTYSHSIGDKTLALVGETMKKYAKPEDVVMRLGGDEFAFFILGVQSDKELQYTLDFIQEGIAEIHVDEAPSLSITVSIGGVICKGDNLKFNDIYNEADHNLYMAKNNTKGKCVITESV
jgi:diguanylate cyclase (GGDEF)-like protein